MIRTGIIGLGWAGNTHLQSLKGREGVEITALCDLSKELLAERAGEFGGRGYSDYGEMLDREKLDAVWLCTPSLIRREPLLLCADRKIPVFCEKPVELRGHVAEEIDRELVKRDAQVQVGYVFRSMPLTKEARKAIEDDRIHLVQSLYCCPASLTNELSPWFYESEKSGGPIVDQATHNLDLLRYLFGEVAEATGFAHNPVKAKEKGYTVDEVVSLNLRFDSGMLGTHMHTWVGDKWRNEMIFLGEKRRYLFDLVAGRLTVREGKGTWDFNQDQDLMYSYQNDIFLEEVKTGDWSRNPSTYSDALKTLKLALKCQVSASGGRPPETAR